MHKSYASDPHLLFTGLCPRWVFNLFEPCQVGFDGSDHPVSEGLLCLLAPRYQTYQRHLGRRMKGEKERKKKERRKKEKQAPTFEYPFCARPHARHSNTQDHVLLPILQGKKRRLGVKAGFRIESLSSGMKRHPHGTPGPVLGTSTRIGSLLSQ